MKLFLLAGEASGDRLGAALMDGLAELAPGAEIRGIGGAEMTARGLSSLFPMEELSVMGLAEILPRYPQLRRRLGQTIEAVLAFAPDALVTIDSPDFSLRVARAVRAARPIRTVHYVAPTVWAWRPGRAARMAPFIDQVLALFPFEPPYMEAEGMRCDFVGHPVVASAMPDASGLAAARAALEGASPALAVLPGSRRGEVRRMAPVFGEVLRRVADRHPSLAVTVPVAPGLRGLVEEAVDGWPVPARLVEGEARTAAVAACDAALAASGTVSLELARARVPMVIGYDMHPVSRAIIARMLRTDTVTLVNLVGETRVVPEFIGRRFRPGPMAAALERLFEPSAPERAAQLAAFETVMDRLGEGGEAPGLRAARAVLDGMG